ncbi:unnamed protein product [marine sediment metagenome]|uniref:Uncharacterized protein n=1 Tax=marine sediment metagenome TaxID=412755 RepID=X0VGP2_9ZZZZ
MKRTMVLCLAVLLGINCGIVGVWFGKSLPYPETPILVDGDALRASMLDASVRDTQNWILENYILDRDGRDDESTEEDNQGE